MDDGSRAAVQEASAARGPSREPARNQETDPPYLYPGYTSTVLRAPSQPLAIPPGALDMRTGPVFGPERVRTTDADLTAQHAGEPIGERIIVSGRVLDSGGRPVRDGLIEIWQANAAGRYRHDVDDHAAPLDPNFTGLGRVLTDHDGGYRFVTVKPGPYPWRNHDNAWRPSHIHLSLFGSEFTQRLVTQMYFEGDPLFFQDPIYNAIPAHARPLVIAHLTMAETRPEWALAYRFDIVLRGRRATPFEDEGDD
jgi:protocatechuate 3,4-dioxygenase beta subunit